MSGGLVYRPNQFAKHPSIRLPHRPDPPRPGPDMDQEIESLIELPPAQSPRFPTSSLTRIPISVPGFDTLVQLVVHLDDKVGNCPDQETLVKAYNSILSEYLDEGERVKSGRELLEEHAYVLLRAYEFFCESKTCELEVKKTGKEDSNPSKTNTSPLSLQTLRYTLDILHMTPPATITTTYFSRVLFSDLMARRDIPISTLRAALSITQSAVTPTEQALAQMLLRDIISHPGYEPVPSDYISISRALSNTAKHDEALKICSAAWKKYKDAAVSTEVWEEVLRGYALRGDEEGFDRAWELILDDYRVRPDAGMWHQRIAVHCARRDGLDKARTWWGKYRRQPFAPEPSLDTYEVILRTYSRRGKHVMADEMLWYMMTLYEEKPPPPGSQVNAKRWWAAVARWASTLGLGMSAAGINSGVDSINYVFKKMSKCHKEDGKHWIPIPDAQVVNEVALSLMERRRASEAEDLIDASEHWNIAPDRVTFSLKTRLLAQRGALQEAMNEYEKMKTSETPVGDDAPELRVLLRAFANLGIGAQPPTFSEASGYLHQKVFLRKSEHSPYAPLALIQYLLAELYDRRLNVDPETLIALTTYHLTTNTLDQLPSLLSRIIFTLSTATIDKLVTLFVNHIKSPTTSLLAAWDSYQILNDHFPPSSLTPAIRTSLMETFFSLERSDMAVIVLTQTPTPPPVPLPMLITSLRGLAKTKDMDNLRLVHNFVKLSPAVPSPPPTELLNALMHAYSMCGLHERALRFWGTIRRSRAGPDHESISIVLDLCGRREGWLLMAKDIWRTLAEYKIKPTLDNFIQYVEAHGRHGQFQEAFEIVKQLENDIGAVPDEKLYVALFPFFPSYPNIQLPKLAHHTEEVGMRY